MGIQTISILVLVGIFLVATVLPLNMGALGFAAAFLVGSVLMKMSPAQIFQGFPGDLFVTLVGVTYLFAIANKNGTVDWLVDRAMRLVGGRAAVIPWVMFVLAAVLTAFGALGPAAVAILAPVALRIGVEHRISPVMMGLMVIHGAQGGGFSPISVYGGIVNGIVAKTGLVGDPTALFLASLVFNLGIAVVVFIVFGGLKARAPTAPVAGQPVGETPAATTLDFHRFATLVGLILLGIGALVFDFNVGLVAMVVAVALALMAPNAQKGAIEKVSWSTVLLICGVITYVAVLQKAGTVEYVGTAISNLHAPLLAALLLCFTGAIVSAFASSVALLGAIIPLAVPFMMHGEVSVVGLVAAISIATTIVDTSPFSTNGALVVAAAPEAERDKILRTLLIYSAVIALIGPVVAWAVLVVPNLL